MANCNLAYEKDVHERLEKIKKFKRGTRITTLSMFGANTAFWGTMGVMLVGPAGVLIGLQFGAFAAIPTYGILYTVKEIKEAKVENKIEILNILNYVENKNVEHENFEKLYKKLVKKNPDLTKGNLKEIILSLNDHDEFCNDKTVGKIKFQKIIQNNI